MRHLRKGRKLKRTSSHKKALMRNLATALFEHKKIRTTEAKAKELRPYAEKLITKAKHALAREQQGLLPDGQKIDVHNRREVGKFITSKAVLQELFDSIAPVVEERPGGYTRIVKTGFRQGDAGKTAIIELVDWAEEQDGAVSLKKKKKSKPKRAKKRVKAEVEEEVIETEEEVEETETAEEAEAEAAEEPEAEAAEEPEAEAAEEPEAEAAEEPEAETAEEPEAEEPEAEEPEAEAAEEPEAEAAEEPETETAEEAEAEATEEPEVKEKDEKKEKEDKNDKAE